MPYYDDDALPDDWDDDDGDDDFTGEDTSLTPFPDSLEPFNGPYEPEWPSEDDQP